MRKIYIFLVTTTTLLLGIIQQTVGYSCPVECQCTIDVHDFFVDCSNRGLTELPSFDYTKVHYLDLSYNKFTKFPLALRRLEGLDYLDISYNYIHHLPKDALNGLNSLKVLDLSFNNITNWADINPNFVLLPAVELHKLSLAGNQLSSMTSFDENLLLISKSLAFLDLSKNQISKITGDYIFGGLKRLEKVSFRGNPVVMMTDLVSDSLEEVDLSNCKLENLAPTTFVKLGKLKTLNLSHNSRLTLNEVSSMSVNKLDVSFCNMDKIILEGFPNLTSAFLGYNMLNYLSRDLFMYNPRLEVVDFTANSISHVNVDVFKQVPNLRELDLSYNSISNIDRDLFKANPQLLSLNLAQNFFQKFIRIGSKSLFKLNVSGCEITHLERDTIGALPRLNELDLSHNLLSELPPYLQSTSLQNLHLQNNRLMKITNLTFYHVPELTKLNLAGNRLTSTLRRDMFSQNRFLQKMRLGDNPWICDCSKPEFFDFYQFLTEPPVKISDRNNVKCSSPEDAYGQYWETACFMKWYPNDRKFGLTERIWIAVMVAVIVCTGLYCLYKTIQRGIKGRELTRRERERQENISEAEEIARQARIRMQQEALLNAPDPRDHNPPGYEEAIRMPKPIFASLDELSTRRSRRKRRARKQDGDEEQEEVTETSLRGHRFRSEEVLSPRMSRLPPRMHPFEMEALERTRELEDIINFIPRPLDEIEEFRQFDSQTASPYTKRRGEDHRRASPFNRRDQNRANKHKANKIASLEELHPDSGSIEVIIREPSVDTLPGPSMTQDASKCLEDEIRNLDEQLEALEAESKKQQLMGEGISIQTLPSTQSSSNNDIEVIGSEDIVAVDVVATDNKNKR
ncbi:platelet glycoprotein V [Culicoides brevitarsis]|uniref:platelet glycoprotein V n=1 Tax=Culicoides brevitarsis TaxID=469753 RepID=UPI00307B86BA